MKTLVTYCIALILSSPRVGALETKGDNGVKHQRLVQADDKVMRVIAKLENIEIVDISFEKLTAAEAMNYLTKKVVGEKGGGVINFVIRGVDQAKKVGITRKSLTYAQAVDEICSQSGKVWMIEYNEPSGTPVLIIKNKNAQQAVDGNRR